MDRLKIIENLEKLERRKNEFENLLNDCENHYFLGVSFNANLTTNSFSTKYDDSELVCDPKKFKNYLKLEISDLEDRINGLIKELT